MPKRLFAFVLDVVSAPGTTMPDGAIGALVPCYVGADTPESAPLRAAFVLREGGYAVVDMPGTIKELAVDGWDAYAAATWPEYVAGLPDQASVRDRVDAGEAFFGPFLSYAE